MSKNNSSETFKSTCSYCGVGCNMEVTKSKNGDLSVKGVEDSPVNMGMLCSKGMNLHYVAKDISDRLLFPQMRMSKNHPMQRVTWDDALDRTAKVFSTFIDKYGPDSVAFYVSGQCLTEEYYLANKIVKGYIGTNNIDTNSRLCMSSAVAGYTKVLGEDAVPISYEDIEIADTFFISGANPAWCHPILFRRIEKRKEDNPDVKIIVVDPRRTQSCAVADLHLQIHPGTDIILCNAIAKELITMDKIDHDFLKNHADGFEQLKEKLSELAIEEAASICGVSVEQIRLAATYIGDAKGFITMWAMGLNQSVIGVDKNLSLINLNLITGHIGKPGSGPFSLTGQPNAMGGREVGGMASLLAAHRVQSNPAHRAEIAAYWGVDDLPGQPGKVATKMFEALETGEIKAIWIICTNPLVSLPNSNTVERAMKKAKFVVVQDISKNSDTLEYADVILPAAGWLEKIGTMTNSDRRISYLEKAIDPPGEARADSEILIDFAQRMGYKGFDYKELSTVYQEYVGMTKGTNIDISGLSHERLKKEGSFQWPVPTIDHPGTPRLFTDHLFYTDNKKAKIFAVDNIVNQSETTSFDFPLVLTTRRIRDQWHTMTKTGKVNKLNQHIAKPFLEINPADAATRQISDGDPVVIESARGEVKVNAKITEEIKRGVVFLPMHWGKILGKSFARANNVTQDVFDPVSKEPDFKYAAVQVKKYQKPKEKILVIGAGAASYRFIQSYREINKEDEIHVFSKELYPFYNRVLLPEYVNKTLDWEQLEKMREGEMEILNIHLHIGVSINKIDRENKIIIDSNIKPHKYDKLIVATGSRPFVPSDVPIHLEGAFTMRSRKDADDFIKHIKIEDHVLIVGGGLLGLELASALRKINVNVSVVQLAGRLMNRQLDEQAGIILDEVIEEMGVDIYYNNQVMTVKENSPNDLTAVLRNGKVLHCNAVVYAIGTIPNVELLKDAGIKCQRGATVNDYLQTEDPAIFALGEIAQHRGELNGITAAAESMADVCARHIAGDSLSMYKGFIPMNILKFHELALCSLGLVETPDQPGYEEIVFLDRSQKYYKKCIIKNDKLVGAVMIGDKSEFAEFKTLIEDEIELSDKRKQLLRSGQSAEPIIGKLVCSCNNVGRGNIEKTIQSGCSDFRELCKTTGAGTGCGSCKPEVRDILIEIMANA